MAEAQKVLKSMANQHQKTQNTYPSVYHHGGGALYPSRMTLNKKIGHRLRSARIGQKLSLSELAARTKTLSKSRISNYEQGIRRMGIEEAQELAEALDGMTPSYLLCLDDTSPLAPEEWQLIERYRRTDQRGRGTILRVAESQVDYRTDNAKGH
jgi:transcriptional regulator with XRE-family HTH domain